MKVAIYVEGITEASFVYQLIGCYYKWDWESFRMECYHLDPKEAYESLRDFGKDNAPDYYLIYDSCSDTAVSSAIKDRIETHQREGYDKVVGLRDVYSENYKTIYQQRFDKKHIDTFIADMRAALALYDSKGLTRLCFAIMEIEAWLLAMSDVFQRIDSRLDAKWLCDNAKVDISKDPEKEFFHPYARLEAIYDSISKPYGKHWDAIKGIIMKLQKSDFENLYNSGKCNSFKEFYDTIFK
jgi:hypothetical protein